jgi:hypothetical protein
VKRTLPILALTGGLALVAASAGAAEDLSLHSAPGMPHIGEAVCTPMGVIGALTCKLPALASAPAADQAVPADPAVPVVTIAVEAGHALTTGPAEAKAAALPAGDPDVYGARLQAQLCASRAVFCDVDQSGHYRTR